MGTRRAVTNKLAIQYKKGSRADKGVILDNLVALTGWNRGHARSRLQRAGEVRVVRARTPRAPLYSPRVVSALELCWRAARMPAGKRLAPMLCVIVPMLRRDGAVDLTDVETELLVAMSAATIDRRLAGAKILAGFRGVSHTKPGSLLKGQIPVRTWSEWDDVVPGFVEIDLVGHEGGNSFGEFCFTLTVTDIATGWTINRAVRNKSAIRVLEAIEHCCRQFPFPIKGIDSDNGSEFINADLLEWCEAKKVTFTRSRPGNKNDGCHVEQKNWTHVRELVGYLRYDTEAELKVLNAIWTLEQNYTNLLLTQQKLVTRTRVGSKVTKRHDTAQSPLQRLVAADVLTPAKRAALTRARNALRPAHHQAEVAQLTAQLQRLALAKTGLPPRAVNRAFNEPR